VAEEDGARDGADRPRQRLGPLGVGLRGGDRVRIGGGGEAREGVEVEIGGGRRFELLAADQAFAEAADLVVLSRGPAAGGGGGARRGAAAECGAAVGQKGGGVAGARGHCDDEEMYATSVDCGGEG